MYKEIHTSFDVMKEYLITGAILSEKWQIPVLPPCSLNFFPDDSIDFEESFSRKIKNHRNINVNFYIDDCKFSRLWNNTDKYIEHLKCFHSIIMPDFSIATGEKGMPFALNLYNKYRNHALAWYLHLNNIKVIPSVSISDENNYDWCFEGLPRNSILAVCTNGRVRSKAARIEFCRGFKIMCEKLNPHTIIIIGRIPEELQTNIKILNFKARNQKINEKMKEEKYGDKYI